MNQGAKKIETILFVDDDEAIRKVCCLILARGGYTVFSAENAASAVKVWNKYARKIDLLVTDMMMPGEMDGLGLVNRLRVRRPSLKVLVISGYCAQFFEMGLSIPNTISFLCKPFTLQEFITEVRGCLDRRAEKIQS